MNFFYKRKYLDSEIYEALKKEKTTVEDDRVIDDFFKRNREKFGRMYKSWASEAVIEDSFYEGFISFLVNLRKGTYVLMIDAAMDTVLISYSKNKLSGMIKKESKMPLSPLDSLAEEVMSYGNVELRSFDEKIIETISNCLDGIGEKCKEILVSFYLKGDSIKVIAEFFRTTPGSIKVERYNCMNKLRKCVLLSLNRDGL